MAVLYFILIQIVSSFLISTCRPEYIFSRQNKRRFSLLNKNLLHITEPLFRYCLFHNQLHKLEFLLYKLIKHLFVLCFIHKILFAFFIEIVWEILFSNLITLLLKLHNNPAQTIFPTVYSNFQGKAIK
jgi:hypothetical protein